MVFYVKIALFILILNNLSLFVLGSSNIPHHVQRDEPQDIDIYRAVVNSVNDWQRKQELKRLSNRLKRQDTLSVCYPELGCFEASGPFGYLDTLPAKPEEIGTKFMLYPGKNRRKSGSPPAEVPFEKIDEAFEWAKQGFNSSLPTKVLIHGFGSHCTYIWAYEIRSALMAVEEVNIICVDWTNGAALPNYVKASANTRLVGKQLSILLRGLVERNSLSLRNTHLIGFSLGAHIAGFTGAELGNLSRITGLDPAGPLFESQDPRARLDQTDADFVDVIHSNGENLILGGLGSSQPMGHVDFYPNGGRMQKGCSHLFVGAVSDIIWSSPVEGRSLCNHRRAYKFFIDSISPRCHFPAFPCESYEQFLDGKCFPCTNDRKCGNMGYYADRSKGRGQLYLVTREEEPFCAHQYHVKLETIPTKIPIKSYGKIQITLIGESFLNETFTMTKKDDEEMTLGQSISRILVPHPILAQLIRIEILYTAYTGWLSSGLTQWKMDKVTLMDSFGKMSSICRKNLILESGIPVTLPLHPGDCKIPLDDGAEDRIEDLDNSISNETSEFDKRNIEDKTEKSITSFRDALNFFNIPWKNDRENDVFNEAESSRAFNTRIVKIKDKLGEDIVEKEIVEPILRPHSTKNARSHDPTRDKNEITEPILGPTTVKNIRSVSTTKELPSTTTSNKRDVDISSHIGSKQYGSDWAPKEIPVNVKTERKLGNEKPELKKQDNPLDHIATTVQFIPNRLAKMFEQAEKYARETILPLVSTYTPRFITDIITPKDEKKYVPLQHEEANTKINGSVDKLNEARSLKSIPVSPPISDESTDVSTPYSNIQKIKKRGDTNKGEVLEESASYHVPAVIKSTTPKMNISIRFQNKDKQNAKEEKNVQRKNRSNNPFEAIINTVQVIPENIGKMFEQAERFTRTTVLPLVSSITPRFLTDIFAPRPQLRYIPFTSEESTEKSSVHLDLDTVARNKKNRKFNPPPSSIRSRRRSRKNFGVTTSVPTVENKTDEIISVIESSESVTETVTPFTNIQKIPRKRSSKTQHNNR